MNFIYCFLTYYKSRDVSFIGNTDAGGRHEFCLRTGLIVKQAHRLMQACSRTIFNRWMNAANKNPKQSESIISVFGGDGAVFPLDPRFLLSKRLGQLEHP